MIDVDVQVPDALAAVTLCSFCLQEGKLVNKYQAQFCSICATVVEKWESQLTSWCLCCEGRVFNAWHHCLDYKSEDWLDVLARLP